MLGGDSPFSLVSASAIYAGCPLPYTARMLGREASLNIGRKIITLFENIPLIYLHCGAYLVCGALAKCSAPVRGWPRGGGGGGFLLLWEFRNQLRIAPHPRSQALRVKEPATVDKSTAEKIISTTVDFRVNLLEHVNVFVCLLPIISICFIVLAVSGLLVLLLVRHLCVSHVLTPRMSLVFRVTCCAMPVPLGCRRRVCVSVS